MPRKFTSGLGIVDAGQLPSIDGQTFAPAAATPHIPSTAVVSGSLSAAAATPDQLIDSGNSTEALCCTLFDDFVPAATATYNYFEQNERTTVDTDPSGSLDSIARYVQLSWQAPIQLSKILKRSITSNSGFNFSALPVDDFALAKSAAANGFVNSGRLNAAVEPPQKVSTVPTFDEQTFLQSSDTAGLSATKVKTSQSQNVSTQGSIKVTTPVKNTSKTQVNFVDLSLGGIFSQERASAASEPYQLNSMGALAKIAQSLESLSSDNHLAVQTIDPPSFPAPPEFSGLVYMGFVIEKYYLDADGVMHLDSSIDVTDPTVMSYVDRDVLFEVPYLYRIRSLVRWTRSSSVGFSATPSPPSSPYVSSFYESDWSSWAATEVVDSELPDPPDEIYVRPVSDKQQVHVVWKMPNDPQRDISVVRLFRKKVTVDLVDMTDWQEIFSQTVGNGIFIDRSLPFSEDDGHAMYCYAMVSDSVHAETSALSVQIAVCLSKEYVRSGERPLRQISIAGIPLEAKGSSARNPSELPDIRLAAQKTVAFSVRQGRSQYPLFHKDYVVFVQSLANGQIVRVPLTVDSIDEPAANLFKKRAI